MNNLLLNQLSIENLLKEEEFIKEFNNMQILQIRLGLLKGLDVSLYAKSEFNDVQMYQIRLGLEQNLDVSIYAKPEFNYAQMREIRKGLLKGLDVSVYAKPEYNWKKMEKFHKKKKKIKYKKLFVKILASILSLLIFTGFIGSFYYFFYTDFIVDEVVSQEHIEEKTVSVISSTPIDSKLSVDLGTRGIFNGRSDYNKDDIYGYVVSKFVLEDSSEIKENIDIKSIYNKQLPDVGSKLTYLAHYRGTYKLKSGKVISRTSLEKIKSGDRIMHQDHLFPYYKWEQVVPYTNQIPVGINITWTTSNGKYRNRHYQTDSYIITP